MASQPQPPLPIPLGVTSYQRDVAGEPEVRNINRYLEKDPTNVAEGENNIALLRRPALRRWLAVGDGPIRGVYSQPGSFNDAMFTVSYDTLYRIDTNETTTALQTGISGGGLRATVSMAARDDDLWIADGRILWRYDGATTAQVVVPDDVGVVSVGAIASYVIVVIAQGFGVNGRFYWVKPGESTIDSLNFANAERSPDPLWSVDIVGDQFWLPGTSTNEVWYLSGEALAPFMRVQGRLFDRGVREGTPVNIKDTVVLVDTDGVVYKISGEGPERVSNPGIEERIRAAIIDQTRHL